MSSSRGPTSAGKRWSDDILVGYLGVSVAVFSPHASGQPAAATADAYDDVIKQCEALKSGGNILDLAHCWHRAAAALPEESSNKAVREHAVIAMMDAYKLAFEQSVDDKVLKEALDKYSQYVQEWGRAYGSLEGVAPEVHERAELFARLKEKYGVRVETVKERVDDKRTRRLQIAGSAAPAGSGGAMALFIVAGVFGQRYERAIDGELYEAEAAGSPIHLQGMAYNRVMLVSGLVAGALLSTGAALLGAAARSKKRQETASVRLHGLGLKGHF